MRQMGLEAIYPKPKNSRPHPEHKVYRYLLRNMSIDHANQLWSADIIKIPMSRGAICILWMSWTGTAVRSCSGASRRYTG